MAVKLSYQYYLFLGLVLMAFFPLVPVLHQSTGLLGALLASLGIFFAFNLGIKVTLANYSYRNLSFMLLFLLYYFASALFSRSIAEVINDYNVVLIPLSRIAFFMIFINVKSRKQFHSIIHVFLIAASIESLIGISQVLFEFPVPIILERGLYHEPRNYLAYVLPFFSKETVLASGSFEHFNGLGGFLILALPIAFGFWLKHKKKIYFLASLLIFTGIVCTFSRGALLSSIIVLLFQYFSFNNNKKLKRLLILGGVVFFIFAFSNINNYVEDTGNTISRYLTWIVALEHAFSQPWRLITGFGLFYFRDNVLVGVLGNLHSSFLQILLEMGVIGMYLYYKAMKKIIQTMRSSKTVMNYTLIAIVIGFTVSQLVDNSLFGYTGTLFIALIALFLSQADLPKNKIVHSKTTT